MNTIESHVYVILGRAVTWVRGFVNNFLRVPLACLGSREAAVQPGALRKHFTTPLSQVAARPSNLIYN